MANITPHFYTKKALLSRDIDFQQTSMTSFRGSTNWHQVSDFRNFAKIS